MRLEFSPASLAQSGLIMLLMSALLLVASCAKRVVVTGDDLVAACQAEVAPAGTYEYIEGQGLPVMTAVEDGSEAGAAAFNACIQRKAAEAGLISNPITGQLNPACPKGAPMIYGGATYCIGNK